MPNDQEPNDLQLALLDDEQYAATLNAAADLLETTRDNVALPPNYTATMDHIVSHLREYARLTPNTMSLTVSALARRATEAFEHSKN